jgi:hypothetical protein
MDLFEFAKKWRERNKVVLHPKRHAMTRWYFWLETTVFN